MRASGFFFGRVTSSVLQGRGEGDQQDRGTAKTRAPLGPSAS